MRFKFWASSLLINSIFQAVPVAPEHVWLEAADAMRDLENFGYFSEVPSASSISLSLLHQVVAILPGYL